METTRLTSAWSRRRFLRSGLAGTALAWGSPGLAADNSGAAPINISSDRQLFLDDSLVDLARTREITRTMNPPQNIHRVLKPDRPWEALGFIFYASVVDDGGTAKLFHGSYDAEKGKHFSLATSRDGLHWQRPRIGLKDFHGSKENNILPIGAVEAGAFLDPNAPAEKRYRLLFTKHWPDPTRAGVYLASSADGIGWVTTPQRLLPFLPDSQPSGLWDKALQQYVIYLRAWNPRRSVARVAVNDLESPWPYVESIAPRHHWGKDKIPTLSRDGITWNRWRRPYVAAGYHDGIDLRLVSMGQGMVRRGRSLYQYFVGWPHSHGRPVVWDHDLENRAEWLKRDLGGIYVATQRVDGFVSMDAAYTGGLLTTRPLLFEGNRLCLNLHTSGSGTAKVAILDTDGTPIPGFTAADCDVINADAIDFQVKWQKGVGVLAGQPVRLQLSMRNTKLYAIQFMGV